MPARKARPPSKAGPPNRKPASAAKTKRASAPTATRRRAGRKAIAPPRRGLCIAVTGTPGAGKTTVAALAAREGARVVDVKAWATAVGAVAGHDAEDQADAIDVEALRAAFAREHGARGGALPGTVIYEGHLAHLLPVDVAWVIRCDPRVLGPRLAARGYAAAKVQENVEAEALDIILQEALDSDARVIQRDATHRTPAALLASFQAATSGRPGAADIEAVDWSPQLPVTWPPVAARRSRGRTEAA